MSIYSDYERELYAGVMVDVRKHKPDVKAREAWVWKAGRDHWEFHYGQFYWHGSATGAYEARANGWTAWLRKEGVEGYRIDE